MLSAGWQGGPGWSRQGSHGPRSSPSPARLPGPGTFQFFLPCLQAQLSNLGTKVSGIAIRGKSATSQGAAEPLEVLNLVPDNELASFSSHLFVS